MRVWKRMGLLSSAAVAMALQPQAGASASEFRLEEIVVTAQKRAERLQDVPLSITALSMDRIVQMGAVSFTDYARTIPSLSFIDRGPGRNAITIRGITTGAEQGRQALVSVYFDDMPVSAPANQPDLHLFDIERIEVLRGPQGTLYGAGSMGGAIKLVAAKPDPGEFAAKVDTTLSTTRKGSENYRLNAMVNAPIIDDRLALRVVGYYRDESGYVDNVGTGDRNINNEETWGGRASLRFTPSERMTLTATILHQDMEVGGTQETDAVLAPLQQDRRINEVRKDRFTQYNLTLDYAFDWAELTSSTTYFDRDFKEQRDVSAFLGNVATVLQENSRPVESFSQEVRLASVGDGPLRWIAGVFYIDERDKLLQDVPHDGFMGLPTDMLLLENVIRNKTEQVALFGEATYAVIPGLDATVGLRWFDVSQSYDRFATGPIVGGTATDESSAGQNKVNPKFGLSYKMTDDAMVYAQAAQGFRVGGPNSTLPPDPVSGDPSPSEYKADTLWNYELGVKTSWLDNRLTLNSALFYIDWTDIQVTIIRSDGFSFIGNAAKARSQGAELEFTARPVDGLDLRGGFSYTDAKLKEDVPGLGGARGDRIPLVPRYNFSASARYSFPLTRSLGGFTQFDYQHVGSSYNGFNQTAADQQGSYDLGALRAGVEAEHWQLTLFVDNLWDKRAELYVDTTLGDKRTNVNRPRTIGVNLQAQF